MSEETKNQEVAQWENTDSDANAASGNESKGKKAVAACAGKAIAAICCICLMAVLMCHMILAGGSGTASSVSSIASAVFMDKFDMFMVNKTSDALDGILNIEKVYWLSDQDLVAPEPNPGNYGTAQKP